MAKRTNKAAATMTAEGIDSQLSAELSKLVVVEPTVPAVVEPVVTGELVEDHAGKIIQAYDRINSASREIGDSLLNLCLEIAKQYEADKAKAEEGARVFPNINELHRVMDHFKASDPQCKRMATVGILNWLEQIANFSVDRKKFRIFYKTQTEYDRTWGMNLRNQVSWDEKMAQDSKLKPFKAPDEMIAKELAKWVLANGMKESDLDTMYPAIAPKVRVYLKDEKINKDVMGRIQSLEKEGLAIRE